MGNFPIGGAVKTSSATPGVWIAYTREVGRVGNAVSPVRDRAVVRDVGAEERTEPVLLRKRTVPALPAVCAARVNELRTPGRAAVVLLAHEVHVDGFVSGSCGLRHCEQSSNSKHHRDDDASNLLFDGHFSP